MLLISLVYYKVLNFAQRLAVQALGHIRFVVTILAGN
jgi:hypothetical protein